MYTVPAICPRVSAKSGLYLVVLDFPSPTTKGTTGTLILHIRCEFMRHVPNESQKTLNHKWWRG